LAVPQKQATTWQWWQDDGPVYQGQRHDLLYRQGCSLRGKGATEAQLMERLNQLNQRRCIPPLNVEEVTYQARWIATRYPAGRGGKGYGYAMENLRKLGTFRSFTKAMVLILWCLETRCGDGGWVELTYGDFRQNTGLGTQAISDGIRRLVEIGLVEKGIKFHPRTGWRISNTYRLTVDSREFYQYCKPYLLG
jgi:hypothetical protein